MKNNRLLHAIGQIDDAYVTEAVRRRTGKTLWLRVSSQLDARFDIICETLERCAGNQKAIVYVLYGKQRLAWQKGVDIQKAREQLVPIIGAENAVIK